MAELNGEIGNDEMKNGIPFGGELPMSGPIDIVGKAPPVPSAVPPVNDLNSARTGTEGADIVIGDARNPLSIVKEGSCATGDKEENLAPAINNGGVSDEPSAAANIIQIKNFCDVIANGTGNLEVEENDHSSEQRCDKSEGEKVFDEDLSNKVKVVFNLDGLKEAGGLLYIGCKDELRKTNPSKIAEWFTPEFLNLHGVYAIKEEEPFLLRVFTRNHESTNRGIRKKGGRKARKLSCDEEKDLGFIIISDLKPESCVKKLKRNPEIVNGDIRFLTTRTVGCEEPGAPPPSQQPLRSRSLSDPRWLCGPPDDLIVWHPDGCEVCFALCTTVQDELKVAGRRVECNTKESCLTYFYPCGDSSDIFPECLVEIQENCCGRETNRNGSCLPPGAPSVTLVSRLSQPKVKRKPPKHKALTLGPAVVQEVVQRVPFDIYTVNENNERIAWKPPSCHKSSPGDEPCQIVFKGARMKRRCMDLPVPLVLIYRKLDCKLHHCNFTLFHPNSRNAFKNDPSAKASVNVKMYGDIVMTQEFYHYFVSLLSIMKMKSSQTARHLTSVWETIIAERLGRPSIPDEYRKIITLSKQTVKSLWSSIEEEAGNKGGARLMKGPRRKKKPLPPPTVPTMPTPPNITGMNPQASMGVSSCSVATVQVNQPGMQHHCMKRINHMPPKPVPPSKPPMMGPPPHNHIQQPPPQLPVNHPHWLSQGPQYPHNMAPYPMAPPPAAEYYPMPGHFMAQYTPATMGTSP
ncbi:uncharacterized protein [Macrobrachium rosenbergii]|uniref:uncharacterized protein n=1 Tax=Macrobrachium rosenbergii TaxID=79674 RepID=UPI0034D6671F